MKSQAERIKDISLEKWLDEPMNLNEFYDDPPQEIELPLFVKMFGVLVCIAVAIATLLMIAKLAGEI